MKLLNSYGYECAYSDDWQNIIQLALQESPDLILLDINLPLFDGFHICREIRKQSEVPIIVVTSRSTDIDELMSMNLGADDFITRLPDGYDTMLTGNGENLSQGQRQLLSIARAAVADPPVMILDEATSSIDTRTESIVQAGMDGLMYGRTVFVIAHRLSTIQNADVIMVLQLGHIIERGNHEQLIAEHGKYYQLYTGAFELE